MSVCVCMCMCAYCVCMHGQPAQFPMQLNTTIHMTTQPQDQHYYLIPNKQANACTLYLFVVNSTVQLHAGVYTT